MQCGHIFDNVYNTQLRHNNHCFNEKASSPIFDALLLNTIARIATSTSRASHPLNLIMGIVR
jgi:hypothetical protein